MPSARSTATRSLALAALALAGCAGAPPRPSSATRLAYAVRFEPGPDAALACEVTVAPAWPGGRWVLALPPLEPLAVEVTPRAARPLEVGAGGAVELPAGTTRVAWRYPLARARDASGGDLERGAGEGGAWCVSGTAYLLRPEVFAPGLEVALAFTGPTGAERTDGPPAADDAGPLLPWAPGAPCGAAGLLDPGVHVFGAVRRRDGPARIALLPGARAASDDEVVAWLAQARAEVLTVRPDFPQERLVVAVVPLPGVREASPFGLMQWSAPRSLAIYVGGEADAAALRRDWVAVHEHMHLVHPHFGPGLEWLPEGIATYLSVVARVRSGRLAPEDAWGELVDGVLDGRRQARGRGLQALTDDIHRLHAYRAVYWGGALAALDLDLALREATEGRAGLDEVLARLQGRGARATLDDLVREADEAAGRPIARAALRAHLEGPALARADELLGALGLSTGPRGPDGPRATLGPGRLAALRDRLAAPRR